LGFKFESIDLVLYIFSHGTGVENMFVGVTLGRKPAADSVT